MSLVHKMFLPMRSAVKNCVSGKASVNLCSYSSNLKVSGFTSVSSYHTSAVLHFGRKQRKATGASFVPKSSSAEGENNAIVETARPSEEDRFPDLHTPTREFNGVMFKDLPIVNVRASMNNTILSVTDSIGVVQMIRSCGIDGFKHTRKGTNVAAQATAFVLGKKMMQRGFRTVRAKVQGLGAGRLSSLRGLNLAGVNIISITDTTPISWNPPRARKQRRL